ncbi:MAG: DUF1178 family protein [Hyphomicrobiales bacterium]|nr:DUF1178 family protein [Hyphomicrobiales bacterium]
MIKYSLICEKEHAFEGWFSTGQDFDQQNRRNLVNCPLCNSSNITKTLMAPSISTSKTKLQPSEQIKNEPTSSKSGVANSPAPENFQELVEKVRELRSNILENSKNVGSRFPDEARKIHYGEVEKHSIYGQASAQDFKELVDEGVNILPIPTLPEDNN